MTETTETPVRQAQTPPVPWHDSLKTFIGDLSRPFAMYVVAGATAWAIVTGRPADVIGAAGIILLGLYGAKVYENRVQAQADAQVKIAASAAS